MRLKNQRGFTLMELMVVIVIVAILAAVAVPLYINYVRDAQRTEARGAIGAVITAEQTQFQRTGAYSADVFVRNPTPATQALNCDLTEALQNWDISVTAATPTDGFRVVATGVVGRPTAGLTVTYTYSRATPLPDPWEGT
ncbi:MAG: prepilin-type N-terminal cleavage/methylation domain-containing protein [Candidatus Eisenbacteria bacterium]|uniref:Prepilin-type N-terminal cleavage/methylation domain-containing protein n=1 Tax=Eiseniibacteriota bacterium TaxID=2212470 RepID=A0A849SGE3_UNCEI|nr:prepilin-type N-terminal cleavage/methylation domain-containing protein [Candidatus Eisenbacteria bacterium]